MNFNHIGIKITNIAESEHFYGDILGFKLLRKQITPQSTLIFFDAYGITVELIFKPEHSPKPAGPVEHLAFTVDSLKDEIDRLSPWGIDFSEKKVVGQHQIVFFNGPNNERFELMEKI